MPYRGGGTPGNLIAPDTRRRDAVLLVGFGMVAGSLLTIGARALPSKCPFEQHATVRYEAARDAVTPVEPLAVMSKAPVFASCPSKSPYDCF